MQLKFKRYDKVYYFEKKKFFQICDYLCENEEIFYTIVDDSVISVYSKVPESKLLSKKEFLDLFTYQYWDIVYWNNDLFFIIDSCIDELGLKYYKIANHKYTKDTIDVYEFELEQNIRSIFNKIKFAILKSIYFVLYNIRTIGTWVSIMGSIYKSILFKEKNRYYAGNLKFKKKGKIVINNFLYHYKDNEGNLY